jgi:hypothetical protein
MSNGFSDQQYTESVREGGIPLLSNFPATGNLALVSYDDFRAARSHLDGFGSGANGTWMPHDEQLMIDDTKDMVLGEQQKLIDSYDDPIAAFAKDGLKAVDGQTDTSDIPKARIAPVYIDGRYELREKEFAENRRRRAEESDAAAYEPIEPIEPMAFSELKPIKAAPEAADPNFGGPLTEEEIQGNRSFFEEARADAAKKALAIKKRQDERDRKKKEEDAKMTGAKPDYSPLGVSIKED